MTWMACLNQIIQIGNRLWSECSKLWIVPPHETRWSDRGCKDVVETGAFVLYVCGKRVTNISLRLQGRSGSVWTRGEKFSVLHTWTWFIWSFTSPNYRRSKHGVACRPRSHDSVSSCTYSRHTHNKQNAVKHFYRQHGWILNLRLEVVAAAVDQ